MIIIIAYYLHIPGPLVHMTMGLNLPNVISRCYWVRLMGKLLKKEDSLITTYIFLLPLLSICNLDSMASAPAAIWMTMRPPQGWKSQC